MSICVLCETEITTENNSKEHLIPNALGGRKKVVSFICRNCNATAGETWDAELARQLLPLSHMFDISRERGNSSPLKVVTTAGEQLTVGPANTLARTNPVFNRTPIETGIQYQINARSMEEARDMLNGLKRKHPEIDVEATLACVATKETYPQGDVIYNLCIGGELAGRSIVKSCLSMAFSSGIGWTACQHAVNYLRQGTATPCFGYYNEKDLVSDRGSGVPLHCIVVRADPESGLILAYAEYYGLYRIVSCLGEAYDGPLVCGVHALDPRQGVELDVDVELSFSRSDIDDIYNYKRFSTVSYEQAASAVIGPALEGHFAAERQRVLNQAVQEAFEMCGARPGEMLTEEHLHRICKAVAERLAPLILHRLRPLKFQ